MDKDQEDILLLPPGHQTFPRIKISEIETELEKCTIKANWDSIREMRKNEDDKVKEEKEVVLKYQSEHCDKYGNILDNNLNENQLDTIKKLKKKITGENLVCYKTDKTGNIALDTIENYSKKMFKHIGEDEVITEKRVKTIENVLKSMLIFG